MELGDGGPSDSSWEFVSECGSVVGSDVLVLAGVGVSALSVVIVVCEGVFSGSELSSVEPQSFSLSKKRNFACVEGPGRHELRRNASKGSSLP